MRHAADQILEVLDRCAESFFFPALDNGYVYPAATRLTLLRSPDEWGLAIEVFGFSPRAGLPDVAVYSYGSALRGRKVASDFINDGAFRNYKLTHPHDEVPTFSPVEEGDWQDQEDQETVSPGVMTLRLRGRDVAIPQDVGEYEAMGIILEAPPSVRVFELCRYLAATHRDEVLAIEAERRTHFGTDLREVLRLEEWHHPDVTMRPSATRAFQQFADVLASGDASQYRPTEPANTHWRNWPDAGKL